MFTGIVEGLCPVVAVRRGAVWRLTIELGELAEDVKPGDSVAIDGACLTAVAVEGSRVDFEAIGETLARTTLASSQVPRPNPLASPKDSPPAFGHFPGPPKSNRPCHRGLDTAFR